MVIPPFNKERGENKWVIEKAIKLPSDISIVVDNAYMVMADGVFDNMFINENLRTDEGRKKSGTQKNITIEGIGNAVLSGGNYNGLSEAVSGTGDYPHVSYNNMILFAGVDSFTVKNLKVKKQRWMGGLTPLCKTDIRKYRFLRRLYVELPDGVSREEAPSATIISNIRRFHVKTRTGSTFGADAVTS